MRGWSSAFEKPLKKPALDIVEVVSDLVDLTTVISDDSDDGGKKAEKKAKKALKRQERERRQRELREEQRAKAKAAREEQLQREVEDLARRKADEAALRAAARRDGYDRSLAREAPSLIEDIPEVPREEEKAPTPPEPAAERPSKRQRGTPRDSGKERRREPSPTDAPPAERPPRELAAPQRAAVAPAEAAPPPREPPAPAAAKPRAADGGAAPEAAKSGKAAAGKKAGLAAPSMAEAIAAAQKVASPFASFEGFDAQASHEKAHGLETEEFDPDDDDEDDENPEGLLPVEFYSLQDLPEELLLADMSSEPGLYIAHYIRYVLGAWQRMLASGEALGDAGLTNQTAALFQSKEKFQSTAEALKPLLRQLRSRKIGGEMLSGLETVVKLAAEREYNHANSEYVGMTMGRKTWHNSLPCFQQQQNHGGSVRKIIKQSELVDFDWDPVVQAYMYALKRVIQFAQCIRPPDDPAKCA